MHELILVCQWQSLKVYEHSFFLSCLISFWIYLNTDATNGEIATWGRHSWKVTFSDLLSVEYCTYKERCILLSIYVWQARTKGSKYIWTVFQQLWCEEWEFTWTCKFAITLSNTVILIVKEKNDSHYNSTCPEVNWSVVLTNISLYNPNVLDRFIYSIQ